MHAIVVLEPGGSERLTYREVSDPSAGSGELLVRTDAAGVNFIDVYRRRGAYPVKLPHIPGIEGAGIVVDVGKGVSDIRTGDRVAWVWVPDSYAELVAVPATMAIPVPSDVDNLTAAASLLQGITAHFLAYSVYPVQAGDNVLIHAAAGGVGLLLTQLAAQRGARVIGTVSTPEKEETARASGAQAVIRYDLLNDITEELPRLVRDLSPNGVHVVYDGVGKDTFDASLASLRWRGTLVLFGEASGPVPPLDLKRLNSGGSLYVTRPNLSHFIASRDELLGRSDAVLRAVGDGRLHPRISRTFVMRDAARAHDHLESRVSSGKVLLTVPKA